MVTEPAPPDDPSASAAQKIYIHLKYSRRIMQPCGSTPTKPFHNLLIVEVTYAGSVTMESGTAIR